jgi:hypothetical protein
MSGWGGDGLHPRRRLAVAAAVRQAWGGEWIEPNTWRPLANFAPGRIADIRSGSFIVRLAPLADTSRSCRSIGSPVFIGRMFWLH